MIINFTGQPESGKTTLSQLLRKELNRLHPKYSVVILDGDVIRGVTNNFDYTPAGRKKNIENAYSIAADLEAASKIDTGFKCIVIIAVISPYLDLRETIKEKFNVCEFYLTSDRNSRAQYNVPSYQMPYKDFTHIQTDSNIIGCLSIIMNEVEKKFNLIRDVEIENNPDEAVTVMFPSKETLRVR